MPRAVSIALWTDGRPTKARVSAAAVVGCFAVHRTPEVHPDLWFVSHIPTGMSACRCTGIPSLDDAKLLASLLHSLGWGDWQYVQPNEQGPIAVAAKRLIRTFLRGNKSEAARIAERYCSSLGKGT